MRPQVYGEPPAVSIVAAGPIEEVRLGSTWYARLFVLRTGAVITGLNCGITKNNPMDQHSSQHGDATVICKLAIQQWRDLRSMADELGVCMIRNRDDAFCDISSIIPVGVPPRYPKFPLPWADRYVSNDASRTKSVIHKELDYLAGKGRIAMCVPGVRGDAYATSLEFFLKYYRKMGVDTVNMYMHSPGNTFARIAESIAAQQATASKTDMPQLVLLPWCVQLGATYACKKGRHVSPLSGYSDFVGTNHGQLLAHQDCLYRSIGAFRWVLFVDLDEYIVPRRADLFSLQDLVRESAKQNKGIAAAELLIRTAFFEKCLPSSSGNVTVPLSPLIDHNKLSSLPRPALAGARVSHVYPERIRTKYVCSPYECDRAGVHFDASKLNHRKEFAGKVPHWPISGKTQVLSTRDAIIHHIRADGRAASERETISTRTKYQNDYGLDAIPLCGSVKGLQEQDWCMTNFAVSLGLA